MSNSWIKEAKMLDRIDTIGERGFKDLLQMHLESQ